MAGRPKAFKYVGEMMNFGAGVLQPAYTLEGIPARDLTPPEVEALTDEQIERIQGSWPKLYEAVDVDAVPATPDVAERIANQAALIPPEETLSAAALMDMTVPQLREKAEELNVDLNGATRKAEIVGRLLDEPPMTEEQRLSHAPTIITSDGEKVLFDGELLPLDEVRKRIAGVVPDPLPQPPLPTTDRLNVSGGKIPAGFFTGPPADDPPTDDDGA